VPVREIAVRIQRIWSIGTGELIAKAGMDTENLTLRRYLLNDLPEDQASKIGETLLEREDLDEAFTFEIENLIEDYLEGSLTPAELALFDAHFLISRQRSRQVEELRLLKSYAQARTLAIHQQSSVTDEITPADTGFLARVFRLPRFQIGFAAGALILLTISLLYFGLRKDNDSEIAELNQRNFSDLTQFTGIERITIASGSTRNSESRPRATRNSNEVLFRLLLPEGWTGNDLYRISLLKDDRSIFAIDQLNVYQVGDIKELRILVPSGRLPSGRLMFRVSQSASGTDTADYFFDASEVRN